MSAPVPSSPSAAADTVREPDRPFLLGVGGATGADLREQLQAAGIRLNAHAEDLLGSARMARAGDRATVRVVARSVAELGLVQGGDWQEIESAAARLGLGPCPLDAAAHLRLILREPDIPSADALRGAGRAPDGALTVFCAPGGREATEGHIPRGFYLRRLDGEFWLRGYRCDDAHRWRPQARLLLRLGEGMPEGSSALPG